MTRELVWEFAEKLKILHCLKQGFLLLIFFLVLSKFGCLVTESGHPNLIMAPPLIIKSGASSLLPSPSSPPIEMDFLTLKVGR